MSLQAVHQSHGATLAPDGIPIHYSNLAKEYEAGLNTAILLDRSHEGRVQLFGDSRFEILNRMSSNKMIDMQADEGRATIFTNPNARIIDRIVAYNREDHLLLLTEPGRNSWLVNFLQKNIFFGDNARLVDITSETHMFGLHGPLLDAVLRDCAVDIDSILPMFGAEAQVADATIYLARRKAISDKHLAIIVSKDHAPAVYEQIFEMGQAHGLLASGGLTYNTLRIRSGHPARPELNLDYIPLEIGLWDEVHFGKGCYTGQEIIARMESRGKLAKTIVSLNLSAMINAPAEVTLNGAKIGKMTSSVQAADGDIFAIAVIKTHAIEAGTEIMVADVPATVSGLIGEQPDTIIQG